MENDHLMTAPFGVFAELVASKAEETPALEFKRKPSPGTELQRSDKKLLGEAISGFANATGGILVIGIGTQQYEGIDQAAELFEIENVKSVASRYRAYIQRCTNPPVEGVKVRAVSSTDGRGIIAILVPQGQARPHMSRAPDHYTYYRRVMDSFVPMEAYEVEEMMRLKTSPKLDLVYELVSAGGSSGQQLFELRFGLANRSRVTAKFPYIEYFRKSDGPPVAPYGLDGNRNTLWPRLITASSTGALFAAGSDQVIHPDQRLIVSKLSIKAMLISSEADMELCFEFGCEDCPKQSATIKLTVEQFRSIGWVG